MKQMYLLAMVLKGGFAVKKYPDQVFMFQSGGTYL